MYFNEKRQELAPFVNLRSDVGFKAVFADRNNKDILIGVLNQILPPEARIEDIKEYSDREQQQDVIYGKKTLYWRCISVVHSKTTILICYLLDYQ